MSTVLPFHLLLDESASRAGEPIDALNASLPDVHQEMAHNPVLADKIWFSIIAFSHDGDSTFVGYRFSGHSSTLEQGG